MKFIPRSSAYKQAERDADAAREIWLQSLRDARERLTPRRLKQDATKKLHQAANAARHEAAATARKHPFIIGGVTMGIIGLLLRKPIMALSRVAGVSIYKAWQARRHSSGDEQ